MAEYGKMRQVIQSAAFVAAFALSGAAAFAASTQTSEKTLTGAEAFGSWEQAKPGVVRLIKPSDLPAPYATESASNAPDQAARPAGAMPEVPEGFRVSEFASGMSEPRVIEIAPNGDVFVADSGSGEINVFRMGDDGGVAKKDVFATGLDQPYGIAFYPLGDNPQYVYIANTGSVVRYPYKDGDTKASGPAETIVAELPAGGGHWTRDLEFSPDGKTLFVSVGSGSNVAEGMDSDAPEGFIDSHPLGAAWSDEEDRADVLAFDPDGKNKRVFATGLRNCSGLTTQPETGALWCVVNERDELGNDLPPDYATHVEDGAFYGWPWYYIGGNEDPRLKGKRPDLADKVTVPDVLFQAHSAPLGIAFYEGNQFPADYKGDAFVAMHGSWNRDHRTGYKIVRLPFDDGKPTGEYQDFMTGFVLDDQSAWGRPVDVTMAKDGSLLVSDDGSGTIWRVAAEKQAASAAPAKPATAN
jgi:glucose/arabinose dehydrogenase